MKKLLSIVLTVAMIASLFVLGASAAPVANYETVEIPLFSQDYQDASKTEWTATFGGNTIYGRGWANKVLETEEEGETNYVIDFTANPEKNTMILTGPQTSIERDDFVIEFDARGVNTNATLDVVVKNPYHSEKAPTGWLVKLHSGAFGTEGKWYSFKVVADLSGVTGAVANNDSANFKAYRKERGGSEWSALTHVTANLNAGYPSYRMLMGSSAASNAESTSWTVSFQCPSTYTEGTFADTNYQLDNIKVYYEQEQLASVTDGVIAEQNYEDVANNTSATTATNGIGKATVMTEDGNSFLKLESVEGSYAQGYTELVSTSDFTRFDWTYEMDVCRVSGENAIGLNLYDVNGSPINLIIPSAELTEGVWYRYKISNLPIPNAAGTTIYMGPIIMKKDITNNGDWEIGKAYILTNPSSGTGRVVIQISSAPTNRGRVTGNGKNINPNDSDTSSEKNEAAVFYLDNLRFTRDEAVKVTNVATTETTASATIAFSNSAKSLTTDTYNVMMVSYDGEGRAVDVALETATPSAGAVEGVELSVDKTEDVRVYVWETSTGTPLLGNVLDISSFL